MLNSAFPGSNLYGSDFQLQEPWAPKYDAYPPVSHPGWSNAIPQPTEESSAPTPSGGERTAAVPSTTQTDPATLLPPPPPPPLEDLGLGYSHPLELHYQAVNDQYPRPSQGQMDMLGRPQRVQRGEYPYPPAPSSPARGYSVQHQGSDTFPLFSSTARSHEQPLTPSRESINYYGGVQGERGPYANTMAETNPNQMTSRPNGPWRPSSSGSSKRVKTPLEMMSRATEYDNAPDHIKEKASRMLNEFKGYFQEGTVSAQGPTTGSSPTHESKFNLKMKSLVAEFQADRLRDPTLNGNVGVELGVDVSGTLAAAKSPRPRNTLRHIPSSPKCLPLVNMDTTSSAPQVSEKVEMPDYNGTLEDWEQFLKLQASQSSGERPKILEGNEGQNTEAPKSKSPRKKRSTNVTNEHLEALKLKLKKQDLERSSFMPQKELHAADWKVYAQYEDYAGDSLKVLQDRQMALSKPPVIERKASWPEDKSNMSVNWKQRSLDAGSRENQFEREQTKREEADRRDARKTDSGFVPAAQPSSAYSQVYPEMQEATNETGDYMHIPHVRRVFLPSMFASNDAKIDPEHLINGTTPETSMSTETKDAIIPEDIRAANEQWAVPRFNNRQMGISGIVHGLNIVSAKERTNVESLPRENVMAEFHVAASEPSRAPSRSLWDLGTTPENVRPAHFQPESIDKHKPEVEHKDFLGRYFSNKAGVPENLPSYRTRPFLKNVKKSIVGFSAALKKFSTDRNVVVSQEQNLESSGNAFGKEASMENAGENQIVRKVQNTAASAKSVEPGLASLEGEYSMFEKLARREMDLRAEQDLAPKSKPHLYTNARGVSFSGARSRIDTDSSVLSLKKKSQATIKKESTPRKTASFQKREGRLFEKVEINCSQEPEKVRTKAKILLKERVNSEVEDKSPRGSSEIRMKAEQLLKERVNPEFSWKGGSNAGSPPTLDSASIFVNQSGRRMLENLRKRRALCEEDLNARRSFILDRAPRKSNVTISHNRFKSYRTRRFSDKSSVGNASRNTLHEFDFSFGV
jgi:hypothetical protein